MRVRRCAAAYLAMLLLLMLMPLLLQRALAMLR
jgi:hypothetical protein